MSNTSSLTESLSAEKVPAKNRSDIAFIGLLLVGFVMLVLALVGGMFAFTMEENISETATIIVRASLPIVFILALFPVKVLAKDFVKELRK